jgi:hypothetical protein
MSERNIVVLDGTRAGDELAPLLDLLIDELYRSGAAVQVYSLREVKMGSCVGCFGCWLKTPGNCLEPDAGRDIAQAVVQSDTTILFTPVTFGGYSSEIKKIQDRWLPLILPYFGFYHGEIHHMPRYSRYPRLVGIGIQQTPNQEEANLFKVLVGRNAINFHAPSQAAEVFLIEEREQFRQKLQAVLVRQDAVPLAKVVKSLMPATEAAAADFPTMSRPGRALLLVGSPKVKSPSTSGILGGYVLEKLQQQGWATQSLTLRANLLRGEGQAELLASLNSTDLLILAFPLYIDALPFLATKALEVMAAQLRAQPPSSPKRLLAISNNGFPEAYQNALALAICQRFAADSGLIWLGGLALGAGEALCGGQPLTGTERAGRPPVKHLIQALDMASAALAAGQPVPAEAVKLMAKTPIPLMPLSLWRWLFVRLARQRWQQQAAQNQVSQEQVLAQPYAEVVK